ncbi:MAG: glycosyltransferase family 9 protein [Janthinobacterium lividum]
MTTSASPSHAQQSRAAIARARVLICRTDNIGDVVLTLPLAGYLKQRFPGFRISFLCRGYAAPVVRCCTAVDEVIEVETLDDPVAYFARAGFDVIIFSKPDKHLAKAAKAARIPQRVGTSHRWYHWLYANRLAHFSRVKSNLHEAQLNFALLRPLGIKHMPALEDIVPLYSLRAPLYQREPGIDTGDFNLVLHPKSNGNGREWPLAHYTELARLLQRHADVRIWVTGSKAEGAGLAEDAQELLAMPNVMDVCGRFDLGELAAFINLADGLVASGTGPMHLSAALGRATLGLFPPVRPIDPGRWGALGARATSLAQEQPCNGCNDAACCSCMVSITPEQVADVVLGWRAQKRAGKPVLPGAV